MDLNIWPGYISCGTQACIEAMGKNRSCKNRSKNSQGAKLHSSSPLPFHGNQSFDVFVDFRRSGRFSRKNEKTIERRTDKNKRKKERKKEIKKY
jgi:hypothetical protein